MTRNAGMPWDDQETAALLSAFDAGASISQLAAAHERTEGGIVSRLANLDRLIFFRGHWHKIDPLPWSME